ncbi:MAG: CRTAC1 family protein [Halioglobus sp.]
MGFNRGKSVLVVVVALSAIAAGLLVTKFWKTGFDPGELAGAIYHRLKATECPVEQAAPVPWTAGPVIAMEDSPEPIFTDIETKTFALAVVDINQDGRDDILIGAHERNPYLLVNGDAGFTDQSRALFPRGRVIDRHGYTFADLDNDGDLDIAIACGGQDGVGKGAPNLFLRNNSQSGVLDFALERVSDELAQPPGRSRSFIPMASADGKAIDLYYATLARAGFPNRLYINARRPEAFQFDPEESFLTLTMDDHGRGVFADFDGDNKSDYLVIDNVKLKIYWHPDSGKGVSTLSYDAFSTAVADFNNDGLLDIFVGALSLPSNSDNLSYDAQEIVYVLNRNGDNDSSAIAFSSQSRALQFNLDQLIQASMPGQLVGAKDIFIGGEGANPKTRIFTLSRQAAAGQPADFDKPGIYIWYSRYTRHWNMKWVFHPDLDQFKGIVKGAGIGDLTMTNFTTHEPDRVTDTIFINQGDGTFSQLCTGLAAHKETTSSATVADFNNDGWLDIIALRQGEQGSTNGDIVVLSNNQGTSFSASTIGLRPQDRLQRSDLIANGFFNEDDKPDIVLTNGFGQIPGNEGSPRLLLNNTADAPAALLIDLRGSTANSFAVGAKATLRDANNRMIGYRVQGLNANISEDTHRMHFGLGDFPGPYTLTVDWPDGVSTSRTFRAPGAYTVRQ